MKKHLFLAGFILFSQLGIAEDFAPTSLKILFQNKKIAWVKFKDNSDGDFFRFYFNGEPNSSVIRDKKDTKERNGKSRVMRLKVSQLAPNKTYKMTVAVIKNNKKIAESKAIELTIGDVSSSDQAPKILKVFKATQRYTWIKFRDNSDGDFFRVYFNGKENPEAIKDFKDTKERNGKSRMRAINTTKLSPNSKFDITIGVIKDGKKIAESKPFTIKTGDAVDLEAKVIKFNREHGANGDDFVDNVRVSFYLDNHLATIEGFPLWVGENYVNFYRIDDNNNITTIPIFPFMELSPSSHEYLSLYPYDNDTKLQRLITTSDSCNSYFYDIKDLDNIFLIGQDIDDMDCKIVAHEN